MFTCTLLTTRPRAVRGYFMDRKSILDTAFNSLERKGQGWLRASVVLAPTGPTGDLKSGLKLQIIPKEFSIIITTNQDYGLSVHNEPQRHVPPREVGRRGYQHYATKRGTRAERYAEGYRRYAFRFQEYVHKFAVIAWGLVGGR